MITLLDKERISLRNLFAVILAAAITGFVTYLWPVHAIWAQWTYVLHTALGIAMTLWLLPYTWHHVRRTVGLRRPMIILKGTLSLFAAVALIGTGVHIAIAGQQEALRWIYDYHIVAALAVVAFLVGHIALQKVPVRTGQNRGTRGYQTLQPKVWIVSAISLVVTFGVIGALSAVTSALPSTYSNQPMAGSYVYNYGEHPFRPSQTETDGVTHFVDERQIAGSDDCAVCHTDIARQWQSSIHGRAASDPAYVTNVSLLATKKGIEATRYCEGCHAPVALLTGQLSKGGVHGGIKDSTANREGVSCMGCHGISQIIHLKGVASYRFTPQNDYLFADRSGPLVTKLRHFLIKVNPRQHRTDMARSILAKPEICATCHAQFMDKDLNAWGWVKMQDDYSAWLAGPFSGQSEHTFAHQTSMRCQDCHFPFVAGADPSANAEGKFRSHRSLGGNTAIPYVMGDREQLIETQAFLQANRMTVTIEKPVRADAKQDQKLVRGSMRSDIETPAYYYLGETAKLRITVANTLVGHDFPGGTIDINEAWLHFRVTDAQGFVVFESGGLEENLDVDPEAHFYRALAIDRHGNHVWKHDLFNMIGERDRNVIPSGKTDIVEYKFEVPTWAKGPLSAAAVLRYRKLNAQYAKWALQDPNIELPIVDVARDAILLPLRDKTPVSVDR